MPHASGPSVGLHRERLGAAERFIAAGRLEEAAALIETALKERPGASDALNAYGALCLARRDFARAVEILGAAATADPHHPGLVANLGVAHQALGSHDEARLCLRRAVALAPHSPVPLLTLATARLLAGDFGEAREVADRLHALDPDSAAPHGLLGSIALAQGDGPEAMRQFEEALRRGSDEAGVLRGLSTCCLWHDDVPRALALAERARIGNPLDIDTLEHLARCQGEAGLWAEAEATCRDVLAYAPDHLGLRVLHARARMALGQPEAALADLTRFTRAHAGSTEALVALAAVARQTGQLAQAQPLLREALRREPNRADARALDTEITLALGGSPPPPAGDVPPGTRIAVPPAMTAGEFVLLARFLPPLADGGGPVRLGAADRFMPLARHLAVAIERAAVVPEEAAMALPQLLRGPAEGAPVPYLVPDPALTALWRSALSEHPRPWIGVLWDGEAPGLPMARIREAVPAGASAVSLMVGRHRHALAGWPEAVDAGLHIHGFADMIAAIANLDLVIGPDLAPLHIAGALGRPGAVAVGVHRPWHWASEGERALWFPTLRVVRQARLGEWDVVVARLREVASSGAPD